jgi:hypothetical protein
LWSVFGVVGAGKLDIIKAENQQRKNTDAGTGQRMDVTSQEEDGIRSGQGDEAGDDKNNSIVVVVIERCCCCWFSGWLHGFFVGNLFKENIRTRVRTFFGAIFCDIKNGWTSLRAIRRKCTSRYRKSG